MNFKPDGKSNQWLSQGFKTALNDEEVKLQAQQEELFRKNPTFSQRVQLEGIYRQIALLNYQFQTAEAKKTPDESRTSSVKLNILPTVNGNEVIQVLARNQNRSKVVFTCTESFILSPVPVSQINLISTTSAVETVVPYIIWPASTTLTIHSTSAFYAITGNDSTEGILSMVEEIYSTPKNMDTTFKVDRELERAIIDKSNFLESVLT